MTSIERRQFTRAPVSIPGAVYLQPSKEKFDAEILDLSIGGAFVHCTAPILLGQEVLLEILFEKSNLNLSAKVIQSYSQSDTISKQTSVVRWVRGSSKSGFGVQFVSLSAQNQQLLQQIIDSLIAS